VSDDVTNGELARRIDAVLAELRRIEDRYVSREAHEALKARTEALEQRLVWLARAAVSGLVFPVLLAVLMIVLIKGAP
jgi:hypothetical protein